MLNELELEFQKETEIEQKQVECDVFNRFLDDLSKEPIEDIQSKVPEVKPKSKKQKPPKIKSKKPLHEKVISKKPSNDSSILISSTITTAVDTNVMNYQNILPDNIILNSPIESPSFDKNRQNIHSILPSDNPVILDFATVPPPVELNTENFQSNLI